MPTYIVRAELDAEQSEALIKAMNGQKIDAHIVDEGVAIFPRNDRQIELMNELCTALDVPLPEEQKETSEPDNEQTHGMFGLGGMR